MASSTLEHSPVKVAAVNTMADIGLALVGLVDSLGDNAGPTIHFLGLAGGAIEHKWGRYVALAGIPDEVNPEAVRRRVLHNIEPVCMEALNNTQGVIQLGPAGFLDVLEAQQRVKRMLGGVLRQLKTAPVAASVAHFAKPVAIATAHQDARLTAAGQTPSPLEATLTEQVNWAIEQAFSAALKGDNTAGRLLTRLGIMAVPEDMGLHVPALLPEAKAARELQFVMNLIARDVVAGGLHERGLNEYKAAGHPSPTADETRVAAYAAAEVATHLGTSLEKTALRIDQPVQQALSRYTPVVASSGSHCLN